MGQLQITSPLLVVWGWRRGTHLQHRHAEGKTAYSSNYRGCRHAKEEMWKKPQGTSKNATGNVFSSNSIKSHPSFTAELQGQADQQLQQEAAASASLQKPNNRKQVSQFRLPVFTVSP
jgi:hypothetical protein